MFTCLESLETSRHVSNIPGQNGPMKKKSSFSDLKSFWCAISPLGALFLLFLCLLPLGWEGRDRRFLPNFSFATELGAGIITCLYDQLPDYSPWVHKMCEEESQGLYCAGELRDFSYLHVA